jgi:hypothetical protein
MKTIKSSEQIREKMRSNKDFWTGILEAVLFSVCLVCMAIIFLGITQLIPWSSNTTPSECTAYNGFIAIILSIIIIPVTAEKILSLVMDLSEFLFFATKSKNWKKTWSQC